MTLRVGYVAPPRRGATPEERAGWRHLQSRRDLRSVLISPGSAPVPEVLWWHTDALRRPPADLLALLRGHIGSGGSLLLTLLAIRWLKDLGLEDRPPDVVRAGPWKEKPWAPDYPDLRGIGGYLGHPVFEELGGGATTWVARTGVRHAAAWYRSDGLRLRGAILGVERRYIRLEEDRIPALEYSHGEGRTLALGAYAYFADAENPQREHLAHFLGNCLRYLDPARRTTRPQVKTTWWPVGIPACRITPEHSPAARIRRTAPRAWDVGSGIRLTRERSTANSFDVGGRRVLLLGRERTGISEVWAHPARILEDLRWTFRATGGPVIHAHTPGAHIAAAPESFTREFLRGSFFVRETSVASPDLPAGIIRLELRARRGGVLTVRGRIDLRLQWPLSERATGDLVCRWDRALSAVVVESPHSGAAAVFGVSSRPVAVDLRPRACNHRRRAAPANAHVEFRIAVPVSRGRRSVLLVTAGSGEGLPDALHAFRSAAAQPDAFLRSQVRETLGILRRTAGHAPADDQIRPAWRSGVLSLHRFLAATPGLGTSLMAGFGDTRRGWDGGHRVNGRPGYAWYFGRDSVWSALGLLACGSCSAVRDVLEFLGRHQEFTGKIAHEITTTGHAHFDAADATPLYAVLMGRYLRASGDVRFCRKEFDHLDRAMAFTSSTDTDGDGFIENTGAGHGWIEGGKLWPPHAELYLNACWTAGLAEAAFVAEAAGRRNRARQWARQARVVRRRIWKVFPHPVTRFPAFALRRDGSRWDEETALASAALALVRAPAHVSNAVLRRLAGASFLAPWGVRMVNSSSRIYNPVGYQTGSVWPLFTGWAMLAAIASGDPVRARRFLLCNTALIDRFSLGHMPEVLHGETGLPTGVCDHQAWSDAMVVLAGSPPSRVSRRKTR